MLRRLPMDSAHPLMVFAVTRVVLALLALAAVLILGLPYQGRGLAVIGGLLLPWAVAMLVLARREPGAAMSPLVAAGDLIVLTVIEAVIPDSLGAVPDRLARALSG
jgi:hypothetical protein